MPAILVPNTGRYRALWHYKTPLFCVAVYKYIACFWQANSRSCRLKSGVLAAADVPFAEAAALAGHFWRRRFDTICHHMAVGDLAFDMCVSLTSP